MVFTAITDKSSPDRIVENIPYRHTQLASTNNAVKKALFPANRAMMRSQPMTGQLLEFFHSAKNIRPIA